VDRLREWAALVGRRNIAYVVLSLGSPPFWHADGGSGPTKSRCRWRDRGRDNLVGLVSLIFFIANAGLALGAIARPVGNEAVDCVRPAYRLYRPSLAPSQDLRMCF
jgi:hypothetical protein